MDANTLRIWGVAVGGALTAAAVGIAVTTGDPEPLPQNPVVAARPLAPHEEDSAPAPTVKARPEAGAEGSGLVFESAGSVDTPVPAPVAFIVRFEDGHPLARAQGLAAAGRMAEAQQRAEQALRQSRELRALCFERFTVGGAEIVLSPCTPAPAGREEALRHEWQGRFATMPGVAYADVNGVAEPQRSGSL